MFMVETHSSNVQLRATVPFWNLTGLRLRMHCVLVPHVFRSLLQIGAKMCACHRLQVGQVVMQVCLAVCVALGVSGCANWEIYPAC